MFYSFLILDIQVFFNITAITNCDTIEENGDSALFLEEKIGRCPHFPPFSSYPYLKRRQNLAMYNAAL